jgi:hypothetical protein
LENNLNTYTTTTTALSSQAEVMATNVYQAMIKGAEMLGAPLETCSAFLIKGREPDAFNG